GRRHTRAGTRDGGSAGRVICPDGRRLRSSWRPPSDVRSQAVQARTFDSRSTVESSMRTLAALMLSLMLLTTTLLAAGIAEARAVQRAPAVNGVVGPDRPLAVAGRRPCAPSS